VKAASQQQRDEVVAFSRMRPASPSRHDLPDSDLAILHPLFSILFDSGFAAPRRWRWNSRPGLES
jgi:hypothetical protein